MNLKKGLIELKLKFCHIFFVLLLINIFSCSKADLPTYSQDIDKDTLIEILVDIHLADAMLAEKQLFDKNFEDTKISYYNYVYKKHNITRVEFNKTIEYYSYNPAEYVTIYVKVLEKLNRLNDELGNPTNRNAIPSMEEIEEIQDSTKTID